MKIQICKNVFLVYRFISKTREHVFFWHNNRDNRSVQFPFITTRGHVCVTRSTKNADWLQLFMLTNHRERLCYTSGSVQNLSALYAFILISKQSFGKQKRLKNEQNIRTLKAKNAPPESVGLYRKCEYCPAEKCCLCLSCLI